MGIEYNKLVTDAKEVIIQPYDIDSSPYALFDFNTDTNLNGTISLVFKQNFSGFHYATGICDGNNNGGSLSLSLSQTGVTFTSWVYTGTDEDSDEYGAGMVFASSGTLASTGSDLSLSYRPVNYSAYDGKFGATALYDELVDRTGSVTIDLKYIDKDDQLTVPITSDPTTLWADLPNYTTTVNTEYGLGANEPYELTYGTGLYRITGINAAVGSHDGIRIACNVRHRKVSQGGSGSTSYQRKTDGDGNIYIWNYTTTSWEDIRKIRTEDSTSDITPQYTLGIIDVRKGADYISSDTMYIRVRGARSRSDESDTWKNIKTSLFIKYICSGFTSPQGD